MIVNDFKIVITNTTAIPPQLAIEPPKQIAAAQAALKSGVEAQHKQAPAALTPLTTKVVHVGAAAACAAEATSANAVAQPILTKDQPTFFIVCNPRFKNGDPVFVQIAQLPPDLTLNEDNLYLLFGLINEHTINQPNPCDPDDFE